MVVEPEPTCVGNQGCECGLTRIGVCRVAPALAPLAATPPTTRHYLWFIREPKICLFADIFFNIPSWSTLPP